MRVIEDIFNLLLYLLCIAVFSIPYGIMILYDKLKEN